MGEFSLGRLAGLRLSTGMSAIIASLLLWAVLSAFAVWVLNFSLGKALLVGLAAVLLHWVADLAHQLGHAQAAKQTGHPMLGVKLWGLLSSSIYPEDEPPLPASVHIKRALGGPRASLTMSIAAAAIFALVAAFRPPGGAVWWLALFFLFDNFVTFTLGSFMPLGFTDGSTLLSWRGKS